MLKNTRKVFFKYFLLGLLVFSSASFAAAYQTFTPLGYSNPATLNTVKKYKVIFGATGVFANLKYNGTANGVAGSAKSQTYDTVPEFLYAVRFNKRFVASVSLTQSIYADLKFPQASFLNAISVETNLKGFDLSPKFSFQLTKHLAFGAGLDADYLSRGVLSSVFLGSMLYERVQSWSLGWDAGLAYMINPKTFLDLSYYSAVANRAARGTSDRAGVTGNRLITNVPLPATWSLHFLRILTRQWALSATIKYIQWNIFKDLVLDNTAVGRLVTTMDYFNSLYMSLGTRFQYNPHWAFISAFVWDGNPVPLRTRTIGLPAANTYFFYLGTEHPIAKGVNLKLTYGFGISFPQINMTGANTAVGDMQNYVNLINLMLEFHG